MTAPDPWGEAWGDQEVLRALLRRRPEVGNWADLLESAKRKFAPEEEPAARVS